MATAKKKFFTRIADWFRGMRSELKKVVWPSAKQVVNNSLVVLAVMLIAAIVVGGFDKLADAIAQLLISLFS